MAAESVEVRKARLEGAYQQINERLGRVEAKIDEVRRELIERIDRVAARLETRMDQQFFWTLGLLVIAILVPIALRFVPVP